MATDTSRAWPIIPIYCGRPLEDGDLRCRDRVGQLAESPKGDLELFHPEGTGPKVMARVYEKLLAGDHKVRSDGVPVSVIDYEGTLGDIAKEIT